MKKYKIVDDYEMDWECIGYADSFEQEENYKNYFEYDGYEIGIFQE